MQVEGVAEKLDQYFRRPDTSLAKLCRQVSRGEGLIYRQGPVKRSSDVLLSFFPAVLSVPLVGVLSLATVIDNPGSPPFFVQDRLGPQGGRLRLIKINTMTNGADDDKKAALAHLIKYGDRDDLDPRVTTVGKVLRKLQLDELPQLWQVLLGQMSLVGLRPAPHYVVDHIRSVRPKGACEWVQAYCDGKPGFFGANSAFNPQRRVDAKKHHYDMWYSRRASLGVDLYIIFNEFLRTFRKLQG